MSISYFSDPCLNLCYFELQKDSLPITGSQAHAIAFFADQRGPEWDHLPISYRGSTTKAEHRIAKSGKPFGSFSMEDQHGSHDLCSSARTRSQLKMFLESEREGSCVQARRGSRA